MTSQPTEQKNNEDNNTVSIQKLALIALITFLCVFSLTSLVLSGTLEEIATTIIQELSGQNYTTTYVNLSPEDALYLLEQNPAIQIIDVRSCKCQYNRGHLPNATWNNIPNDFYNTTDDLFIYSQDEHDNESTIFCDSLMRHVSGKVYRLKGGFNAWTSANFTIEQ